MLVGRDEQRAWLRRQVHQARRGQGGAVLLVGEPGVGKTALLTDLCAAQQGTTVLRVSGIESEANLGFSVLADVCRPLLDRMSEIPEPQAAALSAALALRPGIPGDRFAAYAGALSLLAAAAEDQPLILCVDDAHWVDAESAEALGFCARRLYAEPILMVLAAREGAPSPFRERFATLPVDGLSPNATGELLRATAATQVAPTVANRLHESTGGNPLALIEVASSLTSSQLEGRTPLPEPLPIGVGIERLFWRRIAEQPESVQRALLLVAASVTDASGELMRALARLGLTPQALEQAETAGLVSIEPDRVLFGHPLLRAVVYGTAPGSDRRMAHRVLAEVATGVDATLRRAWHLASAAIGSDESVASELERAAMQITERTGFATAASALERSAELSEDDEARARRLFAAGKAAYLAGMLERARDASLTASRATSDPALEADCARLLGAIEIYAGNALAAHRLLLEAADRIAPHDPAREADLLTDSALMLINVGQIDPAYELSRRALERAEQVGGERELIARTQLGAALILRGEANTGYPMAVEALERAAGMVAPEDLVRLESSPSFYSQLVFQWGGITAYWVDDYERARALCTRTVAGLRAAGALTPMPFALGVLSELDFRTGQWSAALAEASEAESIAAETAQLIPAAYALVQRSAVEGPMGDVEAAYDHATKALKIAEESQSDSTRTYAKAVLGLLELGQSRPDRAYEHLAEVRDVATSHGLREPGVVWWEGDWIETNVRLGNNQDAEAALAQLERRACSTGRTSALAAAARCRGLLAPDDAFLQHFETALELHGRIPTPFELARTQLCFGERLRRGGERRAAREQLGRALDGFAQLGALPWIARAEAELSATGATRGRPERERSAQQPHELLTAQELQVALAVAEGATNKQAAAMLFLSPKTIEFHLSQIYRKLGISSRTQLAHRMLAQPGAEEKQLTGQRLS